MTAPAPTTAITGGCADGSVKVRGIAARRHDTPEYIRTMQRGMLEEMGKASTLAALGEREERVREIYREAVERLPGADPGEMLISRRISRLTYAHRCIEGAAVDAYRRSGTGIEPGMKIRYVVRDARRYIVDTEWDAGKFDLVYYRGLLEKAWKEVEYAFSAGGRGSGRGGEDFI